MLSKCIIKQIYQIFPLIKCEDGKKKDYSSSLLIILLLWQYWLMSYFSCCKSSTLIMIWVSGAADLLKIWRSYFFTLKRYVDIDMWQKQTQADFKLAQTIGTVCGGLIQPGTQFFIYIWSGQIFSGFIVFTYIYRFTCISSKDLCVVIVIWQLCCFLHRSLWYHQLSINTGRLWRWWVWK